MPLPFVLLCFSLLVSTCVQITCTAQCHWIQLSYNPAATYHNELLSHAQSNLHQLLESLLSWQNFDKTLSSEYAQLKKKSRDIFCFWHFDWDSKWHVNRPEFDAMRRQIFLKSNWIFNLFQRFLMSKSVIIFLLKFSHSRTIECRHRTYHSGHARFNALVQRLRYKVVH